VIFHNGLTEWDLMPVPGGRLQDEPDPLWRKIARTGCTNDQDLLRETG